MKTSETQNTDSVFEQQFQKMGIKAQRLYPNEELARFMGRNFFGFAAQERSKIKILEVGCGSGANLWMIAKEGFQAFGMDFSPTGLALCKDHLRAKWGVSAELKQGDFLHLPYDDEFFDAVIDVVSLQHTHLADKQRALAEVHRVLKKEGKFFSYHLGNQSNNFNPDIDEMIDRCTVRNIKNSAMPLANNGVMSFLDRPTTLELWGKVGFRSIGIENVFKSYAEGAQRIEYLAISCQK